MKKFIAILILLVFLAGTATAEMIYDVVLYLDGVGLITMIADAKPTLWESGLVIIKADGATYYTHLSNVIVMEIDTDAIEAGDVDLKVHELAGGYGNR